MKLDPIQLNRHTYDQIAGTFARTTARMDADLTARAARFLQQTLSGYKVLDLGCGPGRDLYWFAQQSIRGIGSDLSFQMLQKAHQITTSPLAQADMRQLPFVKNCFGGVWCNAALIHIPKSEIKAALIEIKRILVSGGAFYVSMQEGNIEKMERYQYVGKKRFFARYTMQEMHENLEKAGFSILHQESYQHKRKWLWFECKSSY